MRETAVRRPSLPLTEQDERDLAWLRDNGFHNDTLRRYLGDHLPANVTESSLLHAIFRSGLTALLEEIAEAGYRELAADAQYQNELRQTAMSRRRRAGEA